MARTDLMPEDIQGLISPHASIFAFNTKFFSNAIENLLFLKETFPLVYTNNGFKESIMVNSESGNNYGVISKRFSSLAQEWIFLSVVNKMSGFIWHYFYQNEGVLKTHEDFASFMLPQK